MPRLPQASDLSNVSPQAARSFVNMPVPDIAGATGAIARGVADVGGAIDVVRKDREEKFRKQERFDARMSLLKNKETVNERIADLDPLDPQYPEKVRAITREVYGQTLSSLRDPENQRDLTLATEEDYVQLGAWADEGHKKARLKKSELDLYTFADTKLKSVINGPSTGKELAEVEQLIDDSPFEDTVKLELKQKYRSAFNAATVDTAFSEITTKGYTLRPDVEKAIKAVENNTPGAPSWFGDYLRRLAAVESAGGYKLSTSLSSAGGIYAFTDATGKQYGMNSAEDKNDPVKATAGAVGYSLYNLDVLRKELGRDPTPGELYLAHQQDGGQVAKLVKNPDRTAASVVGLRAVENNLPDNLKGRAATMKAGDFIAYWGTKFESGTAVIPPDNAMSVLENMPEYQQLDAADQIKVRSGVATQAEKLRKEAEKDFEIATAREYANTAASGATTLVEGYKWIDENVKDPQIAEKARTMFKAEFEANEKLRETEYEAALDKVYVDVVNAVNSGNISAAFAAIPTGLNRKDLDALEKRIADGPIQIDDPRDLERINDLKYSRDPEDQKAFSRLELNRFRLSDATREKVFKEQQSILKELEQTGSAPSLVEPSKMLNDRLMEIGIDTSTGVKNEATRRANLRLERQIKTILDQNLKIATDRAGRKLLPDELQRVMDDTFLEFSRTKTVDTMMGLSSKEVPAGDLPSVIADFDIAEQTANAARAQQKLPPLAPGELLQQAIDERTREHAEAKAIVAAEMKALMSRARSPQARMQGNLEAEYARLAQAQRDLEAFRIDAEDLYLWLARTFKKEEE